MSSDLQNKLVLLALLATAPWAAQAQFGGIKVPTPPPIPSPPPIPTPPPVSVPDPAKLAAEAKAKAEAAAKAALSAFYAASATTSAAIQDTSKKTANLVGAQVVDATVTMSSVAKLADGREVLDLVNTKGEKIGRVHVQANRIISTEVIAANGAATLVPVNGPKLIVTNGKITGREILVGGKVIGQEVFDASGKVVRNTVADTGANAQYVLNKAGNVVLNAASPEVCKAFFKAKSGLDWDLPAFPGIEGLPTVKAHVDTLKAQYDQKKAAVTAKVGPFKDQLAKTYAPAELDKMRAAFNPAVRTRVQNEVFTEQLMCSGDLNAISAKIAAVGLNVSPVKSAGAPAPATPPAATAGYYQTLSLGVAGAKYAGMYMGLTFVTNFKGQNGLFFDIGAMGSITVGAGASLSLGFYPSQTLEAFEGPGWTVGFSTETGGKYPDLGLELATNETFSQPDGFGISAAYGVGKLPVDITLALGLSLKIK